MLALCIAISVISLVIYWAIDRYTYWWKQGVKGDLFVDLSWIFKPHHEFLMDKFRKFGKVYGGFTLMGKYMVVNEPELIKEMWIKHFDAFPDHKHMNIGPSPKVNKMLFFLNVDDDWKRVRSIVTPAFTSGKLKAMVSHIEDISDWFVENLTEFEKRGEVVDMRTHLGSFAMDVISACAYGIKVDSIQNPNHPIVTNAKKFFNVNANLNIFLSIAAPKLAKSLKLNFFPTDAVEYFDELTNQIVTERKRINRCEDKSNKRTDFIQLMLDSEKNRDLGYDSNSEGESEQISGEKFRPSGSLSADEMTAQAILFFIAGYDTTSAALSHLIYFLAQNKDKQQKLYEELKSVKEFTHEELGRHKYLNACIDETLRHAPSVLRIQRQCARDIELGGIKIQKGTNVDVLPYALHRDPDLWEDPLAFKPERFLEPKHHPWAYLPFGGGPRLCVGQRFALNEMRMCCAKLLSKFEFSLAPGFNIEYFNGNIIMTPKKVLCTLKKR